MLNQTIQNTHDTFAWATKRAAIYARVSTEIQEDEGTSLFTQVEDCRRYCNEQHYVVNEQHIYKDVHTGSEYRERPELTRLREALRKREFDVVIIWAIDRLSRVQVHLAVLIDEAQFYGASIEFVQQQFDDSPVGQFILNALGFVGEIERTKIIERTQRGKRARIESGKLLPGRKPLYGYKYIDPERRGKSSYRIDPEEAVVVQRIFKMATEGKTIRFIAGCLNEEGIPSPVLGKGRWTHTIVRRILSNKFYIGEAVAYKRFHKKIPGKTYHVEERNEDEQVKLPDGTVPPLIDKSTFEIVQRRLQQNKLESVRNNHDPHEVLLRGGYAKCGYCGGNMVTIRVAAKNNRRVYKCGNHGRVGQNRCPESICMMTEKLDTIVWQRIEEVVKHPSIMIELIEKQRQHDPTKQDWDAINRTLAKLEQDQINLLANLKELDPIYAKAIRNELNSLAHKQRQLERERESMLDHRKGWQEYQKKLEEFQTWCSHFAQNLGTHSYDEKRLACRILGVKVVLWRADHMPRYEITMSPEIMEQSYLSKLL